MSGLSLGGYGSSLSSVSSAASAAGGSSGGGWMSSLGSIFGGGGSGGNMWGNIFQGILGGLGSMAGGGGAKAPSLQDQVANTQWSSFEARRNIGFAADMEDYRKQQDKVRKRAALDTYGQFSLLSRYAPNYTAAPPVDPGVRPST